MRDIKAGEQLTVSYTNITEPRKIRAAELRATKHFVCACERCTERACGAGRVQTDIRVPAGGWHCHIGADSVPAASTHSAGHAAGGTCTMQTLLPYP